MKNYEKCFNNIIMAVLSIFAFAVVYGLCWVLNAEFKYMLVFTVPFLIMADVFWILFGLHADLEEKRRKERADARKRRESLNFGNNVIYGFFTEEKEKYYMFKVS